MAGQGKGAVRRSRNIVGGGGTTLFLAGVAVGCVLTWSTQRPESVPNPLRASYQNRSAGEESAFPPSPTYEFYTVLPEGGADPAAESKTSEAELDAEEDRSEASDEASDEDTNEDVAAVSESESEPESPERDDVKTASAASSESTSESTSQVRAAKPPVEKTLAAASPEQGLDPSPSPAAVPSEPLDEPALASIRKPKDDIDDTKAQSFPSRYVIQVGSFKERDEVEKAKAELILMGFRVMVQSMSIDGGAPWHRVRVGPYDDLSQTERARDRLESEGFRAIVLKGRKG